MPTASRRPIVAALILLFLVSSTFLVFHAWGYDDPFITFRYARNLAQGNGFVYNLGERILSTTTPLFTIIMAVLIYVYPFPLFFANLIGVISLGIGAFLMWDLAHEWNLPVVGWTALLLYPTSPLLIGTLSSETPLYLGLGIGAIWAYAKGKFTWCSCLIALCALTRPDGLLIGVVLLTFDILSGRRSFFGKPAFMFVLIGLPWLLFSTFYFGSPIPITLKVKQAQGTMLLSSTFYSGFFNIFRGYLDPAGLILEMVFGSIGVGWAIKKKTQLIFPLWMCLYFIVYSGLRVSGYYWYYAPLVPGFVFLVGLGLTWLANQFQAGLKQLNPKAIILAGGFLLFAFSAQTWRSYDWSHYKDPRLLIYKQVGDWLNIHVGKNDRIGSLEVGIIGYYSERGLVDFAGLLQPDVIGKIWHAASYENAALWAVSKYKPDYIVDNTAWFSENYRKQLLNNCHSVKLFLGAEYQYSHDMVIYRCNWG